MASKIRSSGGPGGGSGRSLSLGDRGFGAGSGPDQGGYIFHIVLSSKSSWEEGSLEERSLEEGSLEEGNIDEDGLQEGSL